MLNPKAFLFDMDGVVCHNMPAHEEAWRRFFRKHGIEIELKDFRENTMGRPTREVLSYYFKRAVPPKEAAAHAHVKETLYRRLYGPKRRALPGLRVRDFRPRGKGISLLSAVTRMTPAALTPRTVRA